MELNKPEHPSIWEQNLRVQDHVAMNVQILNNLLAQFHRNEQKAIAKVKRRATLEWDTLR